MFNPLKLSLSGIDAISSLLQSEFHWNPSAPKEEFVNQDFEGNPLVEFLSHGEGLNELSTTYSYGDGTHHIRVLNLASPDIMLVHQSRMVGFYKKLGSGRELREVQRDVKNILVKDVRY